MRFATKLLFLASTVSVLSLARLPQEPRVVGATPNLVTIQVHKVTNQASVLKVTQHHPFTDYLIGIQGQALANDACTRFVGQEVTTHGKAVGIRAVGATDPMTDACIEVMPEPVDAVFTFTMQVLTGGIVPASRFHSQTVRFEGKGLYEVELDSEDASVTVRPIFR